MILFENLSRDATVGISFIIVSAEEINDNVNQPLSKCDQFGLAQVCFDTTRNSQKKGKYL